MYVLECWLVCDLFAVSFCHVNVYTCVCMHVFMHTFMRVPVCVRAYVRMCVSIYNLECVYAQMLACVRVCWSVCVFLDVKYSCMYLFICACACVVSYVRFKWLYLCL